ncbi:myosin-6-like isoform X3 [Macrobrachium rosenbergii]|uniref:myosin-6-like isoform X3 n=1 Tax=Macrobrachium rosenbergii TaxID=79674 RepID=UPI0034D6B69F
MPPKKCLVNPNLRMDGLKNTVAEYGEGMARFSKNLQQAIDRRKSLQEKLLKEKKLTSQAKVQLEVLKGVLKEHEEREKCQETVLNEMKATADRVRSALDQKLTRERELREQLDAKVSEIEGVSRDILFKFRNLKLRDTCQDEEDESKIDEDIISLENEISVIQQEKISLLQKMDDRLKVDELKLILVRTCNKPLIEGNQQTMKASVNMNAFVDLFTLHPYKQTRKRQLLSSNSYHTYKISLE